MSSSLLFDMAQPLTPDAVDVLATAAELEALIAARPLVTPQPPFHVAMALSAAPHSGLSAHNMWVDPDMGDLQERRLAQSLRNVAQALEKRFERASDPQSVVRRYAIGGIELTIGDVEGSYSAGWVATELHHDDYGVDKVPFAPGDIVIDVGAHVGMFSIYLAKRYPDIRIIALEPDPTNFRHLCENLARNGVENVVAENLAVTRDGRSFPIGAPPLNSGGTGGFNRQAGGYRQTVARSITLEEVFARHGIATCTLLKMDCEGAEHEILTATQVLDRVQWFSGEFHINESLLSMGYSSVDLIGIVRAHIDPDRVAIRATEIHD